MKITKLIQPVMLLTGILGIYAVPLWVGGVFSQVIESPAVHYCPIQFPAIRTETLYTNRPVLKDWIEGDIIAFVGQCGHNPLGKYEIEAQRAELRRDLREDIPDDCDIFGGVRGYWGPQTICGMLS